MAENSLQSSIIMRSSDPTVNNFGSEITNTSASAFDSPDEVEAKAEIISPNATTLFASTKTLSNHSLMHGPQGPIDKDETFTAARYESTNKPLGEVKPLEDFINRHPNLPKHHLKTLKELQSMEKTRLVPIIATLRKEMARLLKRKDTKTFHSFGKLPIELRLKIWDLAAREPHVIELRVSKTTPYFPVISPPGASDCFLAATSIQCAIPHVCKEARLEALKTRSPFYDKPSSPRILANPEIDTFWLNMPRFDGYPNSFFRHVGFHELLSSSSKLSHIRKMAFKHDDWDFASSIHPIGFFKMNVEEIFIVAKAEENLHYGEIELCPSAMRPKEVIPGWAATPGSIGRSWRLSNYPNSWDEAERIEEGEINKAIEHWRPSYLNCIAEGGTHEEAKSRAAGLHPAWKAPTIKYREVIKKE